MTLQTYNRSEFLDVSSPGDLADALGEARAELKQIQSRVDFLESLIKNTRERKLVGAKYQVAVSYDVVTKRKNWQAIAAKFNPSRQLIAAHTTTSTCDKLRVSALGK